MIFTNNFKKKEKNIEEIEKKSKRREMKNIRINQQKKK